MSPPAARNEHAEKRAPAGPSYVLCAGTVEASASPAFRREISLELDDMVSYHDVRCPAAGRCFEWLFVGSQIEWTAALLCDFLQNCGLRCRSFPSTAVIGDSWKRVLTGGAQESEFNAIEFGNNSIENGDLPIKAVTALSTEDASSAPTRACCAH